MRALVLLVILCSLPSASALQTPSYWEAHGYTYWYAGDALCEGTLSLDAMRPLSLGEERTTIHLLAQTLDGECAPLDLQFTSASDGLDGLEEDWGCDGTSCYGATLTWSEGEGAFTYRVLQGGEVLDLTGFVRATRIVRA